VIEEAAGFWKGEKKMKKTQGLPRNPEWPGLLTQLSFLPHPWSHAQDAQ
jgi:hypothetical protein